MELPLNYVTFRNYFFTFVQSLKILRYGSELKKKFSRNNLVLDVYFGKKYYCRHVN